MPQINTRVPSEIEVQTGHEEATEKPSLAQQILESSWRSTASGNFLRRWQLEIICWTLSATSMIGIVVMLFIYKGEQIPKWPRGLTLNAYVSILSKVSSATLVLPITEVLGQLKWSWFQEHSKKIWDFEVFDRASRGPWGCFLLLTHTKGRSLAALGAALVLFALAIDPFFQQSVEYPEHWRQQVDNGSIPRALSYRVEDKTLDYITVGIAHRFLFDKGLSPVNFWNQTRAEFPVLCPGSNCTWPEYETLGVCSQCIDATDELEFGCRNANLDWIWLSDDNADGTSPYINGSACGWYLQSEPHILMTGYWDVGDTTAKQNHILIRRTQSIYDTSKGIPFPGFKPKLHAIRNPLAHAILATGGGVDGIRRNATPKAYECVISWCVKTVLSTFSERGYSEIILRTAMDHAGEPSKTPNERGYNKVSDDAFDRTYEDVFSERGNSGITFHVDNYTHTVTKSIFDTILPSTYTIINSTDPSGAVLRYKELLSKQLVTIKPSFNPFLYNDLTTQLDNMATAMTNRIRSEATTTDMIQGSAYRKETLIDVRWAWLSLPLGLLLLTLVFLVTTILKATVEQDKIGLFKNSAIVTLIYGLPDEMMKQLTGQSGSQTRRPSTDFQNRQNLGGAPPGWI